jgi:hypothetical protein
VNHFQQLQVFAAVPHRLTAQIATGRLKKTMVRVATSSRGSATPNKLRKALAFGITVSLGALAMNLLNYIQGNSTMGSNLRPLLLAQEMAAAASGQGSEAAGGNSVAAQGGKQGDPNWKNPAPSRRLETPGVEISEEMDTTAEEVEDELQDSTAKGAKPRLRVFFGIISADSFNDRTYRARHRKLFKLWNDPRVCSLPDFLAKPKEIRYHCEIIYTFVLGANQTASPELVDDSRPMLVTKPVTGLSPDLNDGDMTLLNIKENMNQGKSQTWFKYAGKFAQDHDLDYVVKCDADSILHMHRFFAFAYKHLPPPPYNVNIYAGALRDKAYWPKHTTSEELIRFESYFGNHYEGVHLYIAGQFYLMSTDLAKFVGQEAKNAKPYCEGHEDHDISAMAFHSTTPIHMIPISRKQRFWEHPVKGEPRWVRIWKRETARMSGQPFEGKILSKG